ncbi:MAG: PAS domain S-box protein [Burkholderiales bacterium]
MTAEALASDDAHCFVDALQREPSWSDIPIVLLSGAETDSAAMAATKDPLGNVTVLERPVRVRTLVSALRTAIRARHRQYELRNQMEALKQSEERFHLVAQATRDSVWDLNLATDQVRSREFMRPLIDEQRGDFDPDINAWIRRLHPEDRERVVASLQRAIDGGESLWTEEYRLLRIDGSCLHVLDRGYIVRDQSGRAVRAVGAMMDMTERKRAEEAQALYAAIVESSDDAIVSKTLDGIVLSWNSGAQRIFGYTASEAIGQPITLIIPPERHDEERSILERIRRGERVEHTETVRVTKDGRQINISLTVSPVCDPAGRIIGVSKVARDITARKQAEAALRDSERRLAAELVTMTRLHALSTRLLAAPDLRTALEEVLDASIQMTRAEFGLVQLYRPQTQALEIVAQRGFPQEFIDRFRIVGANDPSSAFGRAMQGERVIIEDVEHDPAFEPHRQIAAAAGFRGVQSTPFLGRGGELLGVLSTHFRHPHRPTDHDLRIIDLYARQAADFLEHLRVKDTLGRRLTRLRLLWEAATVLLTTEDPDTMLRSLFGKIKGHLGLDAYLNFMVNDAGDALRLASCKGIPQREARKIARLEFGQPVCGTAALHRRPIVATRIQESDDPKLQLVKGYGIRAYACNPLIANDQLLGTLSFASRKRDFFEPDELEFLETISRYVTVAYERIRLVDQLRDTDRRKDEFLATLAHELRNPLAPISNALQIMRLTTNDSAAVEGARATIERQLPQLVRLIDDLLDVSRITRGKLILRKERIELASVLQSAMDTVRPLIAAAGHELTISLPPQPVYVDADPVRLAQVFANLLNNAAKYMDERGHIWLTAAHQDNAVSVTVRDAGIGIPATALPSVFEMFTQIDRSLEKSRGGLGIGLMLVKRLAEMHGGSVEARSEGLDKGSEFTVRLPAVIESPASQPRRSDDPPRADGVGRRILVADDNRDAAESLGEILRLMGNEVRIVHDGVQAAEEVAIFRPDVVLLDIGMPRLNGYDAAQRIRKQPWGKAVFLIALTGWGQEEDKRRATEAGFDQHFTKPVNLAVLEQLLAALPTDSKPSNHLLPGADATRRSTRAAGEGKVSNDDGSGLARR